MSNLEPELNPEVDASPVDDGPAAETVPTDDTIEAPPAEPEYDYLDIDDTLASKYVKVKIDGEELDVPLKEALQGYQRQSDYTRKTQEAATLREQAQEALRLQQAFYTDPGLTVQVLARNAGVSVEEFLGMTPREQAAATAASTPAADEYVDPLERQLAEEREARLAIQRRLDDRDADEYLRNRVEGLKQAYSIDDEQAREVVQAAVAMRLGPDAFPMIYESMAFRRLQAQQEAQQQIATTSAEDDARRRAAAAAASSTVSTGTGSTNVTTAPPANVHMSPRDAVLAALDQLGV
jgi:hypothetical protein